MTRIIAMAQLVPPTVDVHESFVAAVVEYHAEGRHPELVLEELRDPFVFARYVAAVGAASRRDVPRPRGIVPQTTLWWVEGTTFLGNLDIRHTLTRALRHVGGHIGYGVRPSARRHGHATAMLRAALPFARELGIDPALVTCDVDNVASRRVIERNGGKLENRARGKLRYWVATSGAPIEPA